VLGKGFVIAQSFAFGLISQTKPFIHRNGGLSTYLSTIPHFYL